jgi:preprotein translocase subunit SecG
MVTLIAVLHLLFCAGLISFVLLQDPKGGGTAGVFSGAGANQLFGTTGAANLLTKITSWCAICFGITCLLLSILSKSNSGSVVDTAPMHAATPVTAPAKAADVTPAAGSTSPVTAPKAPEKTEKK